MTAWALALAWSATVVVLAGPLARPTPIRGRVRALRTAWPVAVDGTGPPPAASGRPVQPGPAWPRALDRLGRQVRHAAGMPTHPRADHLAGRAVIGGALALVVLLAVGPLPVVAVAAAGTVRVVRRRRRAARHEHGALVEALPELVDLVRVAVDAGCTVPVALRAVAPLAPPPFDDALASVLRRAEGGVALADALDGLPAALGEPVRPLTAALQGAERYGAPLGDALERIAADVRRQRRQRAEEAARTLPVRLIFPLVLCTLPALVLLTIAPVVAGAVRSLRL